MTKRIAAAVVFLHVAPMPLLQAMPVIVIPPANLLAQAGGWNATTAVLPKAAGEAVGRICDQAVANAFAVFVGNRPVVAPLSAKSLLPPQADCVEIGASRIIGGIRPQNFDVSYRPDGVRFVYDNKTLNTRKSVGKNYQNMINDLGTEAATVHIRFPLAVVAFVIMVPAPCLAAPHRAGLTGALERISGRQSPVEIAHKAEVISLIVWDPTNGQVDPTWPAPGSALRIEDFSRQIEHAYMSRYGGMPPHV